MRVGVEERGQVGDAEARDAGVEQRLAVVDGQPAGGADLPLLARGRGELPDRALAWFE